MTGWEEGRKRRIAEIVVDTYILCFLLTLIPVAQYYNLNKGATLSSVVFYGLTFALFVLFAIIYTKRIADVKKDFSTPYKILDFSLIIVFLAILSFLIYKSSAGYLQVLFVLPILISCINFSRRTSTVLTGLVVLTVLINSFFMINSTWTKISLMDIVVVGTVILVGWLLGELVQIEKDTRDKLLGRSDLDDLTALYNHRYFQEYLRRSIAEAASKKRNLSLALFDIDYFRYYNQIYGHNNGDQLLKQIGQLLSQHAQPPGIAARTGGDQFALVLVDTPSEKALELAHEIYRQVESIDVPGVKNLPGARLGVSAGVATYPQHGKSAEDILRSADYALYKAKSTSKDKVELYFNVFDSLRSEVSESADPFTYAKAVISIINSKDRYTFAHSERVLDYSSRLAEYMNMEEKEKEALLYAAYLHDIGKADIDREILNKTEKLTEEEWGILKKHPVWGKDIILPFMPDIVVGLAVLYHHENYDGTGYPHGIAGEDIPFTARLLRVIDSYDAMTTDRPYKKGKTRAQALNEIKSCSGTLYDPLVVERFIAMMQDGGETENAV